jgi:hypothetical protein
VGVVDTILGAVTMGGIGVGGWDVAEATGGSGCRRADGWAYTFLTNS